MIEIRPGREEDKDQILGLIGEVFGDEQAVRAYRHWDWQWRQDPRLEQPGYRGVVAEWEGRILGSLSSIPMGLFVNGKPFPGHWHTDNCVHWGRLRKAMRQANNNGGSIGAGFDHGVSAAMLDFALAGHAQAGKHVTVATEVVLNKIGFTTLEHAGSFSRVISYRQPLEEYAGKGVSLLLGGIADVFLPSLPKPKLEVSELRGEFDSRFDGLWAEARNSYQAITRRDRVALNWRYRRHPNASDYTVLIAEAQGEMTGYLVYSNYIRHRQRRSRILDILVGRKDPNTVQALFCAAMRRLKGESVHKVECYATHPSLIAALGQLKFKTRKSHGKGHDIFVRQFPAQECYVTRGDGDGG